MLETWIAVLAPTAASVAAGGLIGLEREIHGRPAGLRTHVLVCLASAALMLAPAHQDLWLDASQIEVIRTDPTRMGQGIMTGIGFLGAGVIFRSGMSIHGLTTAGSLWLTAGIGILLGLGFYEAAAVSTLIALLVLTLFNHIEAAAPSKAHIDVVLRYPRSQALDLARLQAVARELDARVKLVSFGLKDGGIAEHTLTIVGPRGLKVQDLIDRLSAIDGLVGLEVRPR